MKSFKVWIWMVPILIAGILIAGCGNSDPEKVAITVAVKGMNMVPNEIRVKQNDTLIMTISSDTPGILHVHGYDIEQKLQKSAMSTLQFDAHATGMFKIAFHASENGHSHEIHSGQKDNNTDHAHKNSKVEEFIIGSFKVSPR